MRPGPHQIDTTGAADGDVLAYDATTDEYGPQAPGASGVESVGEGPRINVDNTDPANPVVSLATELYLLSWVVWDGANWVTELVADGGSHELMYMEGAV